MSAYLPTPIMSEPKLDVSTLTSIDATCSDADALCMSDFFASLDELNKDPFYQDSRDDLDMDLALSRLMHVRRSSKKETIDAHQDQDKDLLSEPTGCVKQISTTPCSVSTSEISPLDVPTNSKSIDLRKLTLIRSLVSSTGSRSGRNEPPPMVSNQNVHDSFVNQGILENHTLANQSFDQQPPSDVVSFSSPSFSNDIPQQQDHSTRLPACPPVLRPASPVSSQTAFELMSIVTTPNTSLLEPIERSTVSTSCLKPIEDAHVAIVKRLRQRPAERVVSREPRHVKRLRLAASAATEQKQSREALETPVDVPVRGKDDSRGKGRVKSRTGPTLRSLSAVALRLNEALDRRSELDSAVKRTSLRTEPERDSRLSVLAGSTILILWTNVESLVNDYQANWIEKISSLGAKISTKFSGDVTHVIPDSSDFPNHLILKRFNVKHVDDLPKGVKFVSDHWIEYSHKNTSRVDEEPFLLFSSHRTTFGIGPSSESPPNPQPTVLPSLSLFQREPTRTVYHSPTIQH